MLKTILHNLRHPALRPILIGVALFAVFNVLLTAGVTFSPLNKKFNFSYGNFLPAKLDMLRSHQPQALDVLFMGTSQTNNGFITSVFEDEANRLLSSNSQQPVAINSFNLGLPNNRYDVMLGYLRLHVHRYGKPHLVLVELSPSIQERGSDFYYLPALYYRTLVENDPALTPQFLDNPQLAWNVKQELLLSAFSSLHQYRFTFSPVNLLGKVSGKAKELANRLHAPAADAAAVSSLIQDSTRVSDSATLPPEFTAKGWYPKDQSPHMTTPDGVALSVVEARKYYIDQQREVNFDKLSTLLAYCRNEGIPVVLVSWPNHPAFLKVFQQSPLNQKYQTGLTALLQRQPVPVINLNRDIPASQSATEGGFFADPRHLTPPGAMLFSRQLARDLLQIPVARTALQTQAQSLSDVR